MFVSDRVQTLSSFVQSASLRFPRECRRDLWHVEPHTLLRSSFRSFFCPSTMLHLSHLIEDAVVNTFGITEMHVSFQSLGRMAPHAQRYERIGQAVMGQWLYGALNAWDEVADLPMPAHTAYVSTQGTEFTNFWWVIGWGPAASFCLIGEEIPCQRFEQRQYRGFYTTCESTTLETLDLIREALSDQVPPRAIRPMTLSFDYEEISYASLALAGD